MIAAGRRNGRNPTVLTREVPTMDSHLTSDSDSKRVAIPPY